MGEIDLVMGAIVNYTWYDIEPWVVSLRESGYTGDAILVIYGRADTELIDKLKEYNIKFNQASELADPSSIVVSRFKRYFEILQACPQYGQVLVTDVKDVIFQKDPSKFQFNEFGIQMSSEGLTYKNESWGYNNITRAFGSYMANLIQDQVIMNAGVIAGPSHLMRNLFLSIYHMCETRPSRIDGGGGPDQAAYNILMNSTVWKTCSEQAPNDWACQAGTLADPTKIVGFRPNLLLEEPLLRNYDIITTSHNIPYTIVHQWDRVPDWKIVIDRKYRK